MSNLMIIKTVSRALRGALAELRAELLAELLAELRAEPLVELYAEPWQSSVQSFKGAL